MRFYGFWLLLIVVFCITIAVGRNIDCTKNAFLKSKSIACRGGGWTGGNNGGGEEGSGTNGGATDGATGATPNMASNLMRTAQQAMGETLI
ncbi:hypothetical protein HZH68_008012 [Vespula germanica]|uniref:Uncharacterized protein n=1 Tax=Vespula germanica TaxID=30212 RepID=A0A834N777_VESGE|nr:hypothetical protein HZH68_008012 [Vespula germanica]